MGEGGLLAGKQGLIVGVANRRSIAWHVAQTLAGAGAMLAFTYQERVGDAVRELAATLPGSWTMPCDVQRDEDLDAVFARVREEWGGLDLLVHSVAYANREDIGAPYMNVSREGWHLAMDVSAYSLVAMVRRAAPLMAGRGGGSVVTLTYYGGEKVVPQYSVMGVAKAALEHSVRYLASDVGPQNIRVNAISSGPVRTLAARIIPGFSEVEEKIAPRTPLRRNITVEETARAALFLCSDLASGITGEILHVDAGFNIMAF